MTPPLDESPRAGLKSGVPRSVWCTTMGAVLALLVPVLLFGPWLPLVDLVGFIGLYSYPPPLSQGPLHYYTFQFSYIGHHVLSRLLCDLQLPIRFQIPILHLLQAGICFTVVWVSLQRLIQNHWLRCLGIALGTLAFWDGIYLWGGPLAHSLGAASLSMATLLAFRDAAEPERNSNALVALFVIFGVACHPFIVPFALVVCAVRFWFDRRRRWHTCALAGAVLVFGYVIVRDSPAAESSAAGGLHLLFGVRPAEMLRRIVGLFTQDVLFARTLFGFTPVASQVLFIILAFFRAAGFLIAPYLAVKARDQLWLRMVATLDCIAGVLYVSSCDLPGTPILDWPQRVLTLYAPFTFLTGFAGISYLFRRYRVGVPRWAWAVPGLVIMFAILVQAEVFRLGATLAGNVEKVRREIVQSGVTNAYVVISGMDNIRPFYLRCVPFMLFSDPAIIERHIVISTEWHIKARHPTRVTEAMFNLGRKRYLAEFSSQSSILSVRMVEQPADRFPVSERTNANTWSTAQQLAADQYQIGVDLFAGGLYNAAYEHFHTAAYLQPTSATAWNNAGVALLREGKVADSLVYFENAMKIDPSYVDARFNAAAVLVDTRRYSEAASYLKEVLRLKPDHPVARKLLDQLNALPSATPPQ